MARLGRGGARRDPDSARSELSRVGEIDRTERIDVLFEQHGTELVRGEGVGARPPGIRTDTAKTPSTRSAKRSCTTPTRANRTRRVLGGRLVGIGVVVPDIRPAIAQLAFLHVSHDFRAAGVGGRLSADLELVARRTGDTEIVVSATPSENTVRFYLGRGYRPMARPLPELLELEPEDVHMGKVI